MGQRDFLHAVSLHVLFEHPLYDLWLEEVRTTLDNITTHALDF